MYADKQFRSSQDRHHVHLIWIGLNEMCKREVSLLLGDEDRGVYEDGHLSFGT